MNNPDVTDSPKAPIASTPRTGSVRASYYLPAAVMGMLAGVGCNTCFGGIGGIIIAVAVGGWGVIAAIKMNEAPNDGAMPRAVNNQKI